MKKVWMLFIAAALAAGCATEPPKPEPKPAPAPPPPPPPPVKPGAAAGAKARAGAAEAQARAGEAQAGGRESDLRGRCAVRVRQGGGQARRPLEKLDDLSNKVRGINLEVIIAIGHAGHDRLRRLQPASFGSPRGIDQGLSRVGGRAGEPHLHRARARSSRSPVTDARTSARRPARTRR